MYSVGGGGNLDARSGHPVVNVQEVNVADAHDPPCGARYEVHAGFSPLWCGVVWCGVVKCVVMLCGVVWRGVVWCGVV